MNINSLGSLNLRTGNDSIYNSGNVTEEVVPSDEFKAINSESSNEVKKDTSSNFDKNDDTEKIDRKELDKSLKKLNRFLEDDAAHVEYSVHEDFGTVMIKIVDDATKEVILEIPPKKILDMVASMCKQFGLIDKKA